MHPNLASFNATAPRRTSLSRLVLTALCVAVLCASFLLPASARGPSKADASFPTAVVKNLVVKNLALKNLALKNLALKNLASKSGKPCQRMVPGGVGAPCGAGAMVGLAATSAVVLQPLSSRAGNTPFADVTLQVQWLGAPQFRPPRIFA
jgi:hypothetical protein